MTHLIFLATLLLFGVPLFMLGFVGLQAVRPLQLSAAAVALSERLMLILDGLLYLGYVKLGKRRRDAGATSLIGFVARALAIWIRRPALPLVRRV
jgi:hypothetical protein